MTTPTTPQTSDVQVAFQRYAADELVAYTTRVLVRCGMPDEDARLGATVLVDADLMGIDSHGIAHLPSHRGYAPGFQQGLVNPRPNIRTVRETASTATLDADNGFGPLVGYRAMELAIAKAQAVGTGSVAVTNSRHFGAAGYYALMAVPARCIGMAMTNAGPWVTPAGARKKMIGTNPIAVAAPAGAEQPFLMDLATSTVAMGKLEIASREEKPIPDGWALDGSGQPSTDIPRVYQEGGLTPLGSTITAGSYKGYALGAMVDIFCGLLPQIGYSLVLPPGNAGHFFTAWQVEAFAPYDEFTAMMDAMQRTFREAEPVAGVERVLLPGQREFETRRDREANGIPLHAAVFTHLDALADELGVPRPNPLPHGM